MSMLMSDFCEACRSFTTEPMHGGQSDAFSGYVAVGIVKLN